ncbi:hypothetical protein P7K49_034753 [Saguinus oedipus]|uniref:Uncharacterized protein n=1 Tax=Saguinus oedipus TaxID=9490 RepID=A0ABQ9TVL3_SAGOE|nr:hypothetical protein P7K49_034753 [Saguinus oedipus]
MGVVVQDVLGREGAMILGSRDLKLGPKPSTVPTDGFALGRAPLAPPYAVVLISCSGLLAFIFLLLTCLCCKRGDVGFKVRCMRGFNLERKTPTRPLPTSQVLSGERGAVNLKAPSSLKLWQDLEPWDGEMGDGNWAGTGGRLRE